MDSSDCHRHFIEPAVFTLDFLAVAKLSESFQPYNHYQLSITDEQPCRPDGLRYSRQGRVATLVDEENPAGSYQVRFSAASGVYFYRIQTGNFTAVKKSVLVK